MGGKQDLCAGNFVRIGGGGCTNIAAQMNWRKHLQARNLLYQFCARRRPPSSLVTCQEHTQARNSLCQFRPRRPLFAGHMSGAPASTKFVVPISCTPPPPYPQASLCQFRACLPPLLAISLCQLRACHPSHHARSTPKNFAAPILCTPPSLFAGHMPGAPPSTKFAVPISCAPPPSLRWPHARSTPKHEFRLPAKQNIFSKKIESVLPLCPQAQNTTVATGMRLPLASMLARLRGAMTCLSWRARETVAA